MRSYAFDEIFRTEGCKVLKHQCAPPWRTRSPNDGSAPFDASSLSASEESVDLPAFGLPDRLLRHEREVPRSGWGAGSLPEQEPWRWC